jgi:hypothetical protein
MSNANEELPTLSAQATGSMFAKEDFPVRFSQGCVHTPAKMQRMRIHPEC